MAGVERLGFYSPILGNNIEKTDQGQEGDGVNVGRVTNDKFARYVCSVNTLFKSFH